jgi:hypothetical protein
LDSIGVAQTEQQIGKKILTATKAKQLNMVEDAGISSSRDEDAISKYVLDVIKEIEKVREQG